MGPECLKADQKRQRCQSSEKFWNFFLRDPNDFLSVAIGDHGRNLVMSITVTRRQSNSQWSDDIAAHPAPLQKIPSAKIRWKSSRLEFLGSRRHPPH